MFTMALFNPTVGLFQQLHHMSTFHELTRSFTRMWQKAWRGHFVTHKCRKKRVVFLRFRISYSKCCSHPYTTIQQNQERKIIHPCSPRR